MGELVHDNLSNFAPSDTGHTEELSSLFLGSSFGNTRWHGVSAGFFVHVEHTK
ncbi:7966_t:CDS:1, partial [Paraglomus occultum]